MNKLKKYIKTKEDFDKFLDILVNKVRNNESISDNAVLDGFIISFIVIRSKFVRSLFLDREIGRILDGTLQQLEQIVKWFCNNEKELIKLIK
jgi:hypothetical protein